MTTLGLRAVRRQPGPPGESRTFRWLLVLPLLLLMALFVAYPIGYSAYLSVTDYTLLKQSGDYVGTAQYELLAKSGDFRHSLALTATYVFLAVTLEMVIGMAVAMALHRQVWARNLTRAVMFVPMFVAPIAVGLTFRYLLNEQLGVIPVLLERVGLNIDLLGPDYALITLVFIDVWQWTPFMVLLFLAGLEGRPKSQLEAAEIDGASGWLVFRRLTLRMLAPVIVVAVVVRTLEASKLFEYVYVITNGGPAEATMSLQYQMYQTGVRFFRLGEASAMAFVVLALVAIPIVVFFRSTRER